MVMAHSMAQVFKGAFGSDKFEIKMIMDSYLLLRAFAL